MFSIVENNQKKSVKVVPGGLYNQVNFFYDDSDKGAPITLDKQADESKWKNL